MSAEMLDRLSSLWLEHFPRCTKRAHWHLTNLLRFETGPIGATFSQAEGYLKAQIGADQETTKARLGELQEFGLASYDDTTLSARAVINSTNLLFNRYENYHKDHLNIIFQHANIESQGIKNLKMNSKLEGSIYSQTKFVYRELNIGRETYIHKQFYNDINHAVRINYAMRRRAHWTIFIAAWLHCVESNRNITQNNLMAAAWRKGIEEGADTLCSYITELVAWKFLSRKGRKDYGIAAEAVTHFSELFVEVSASMRGSALQIKEILPGLDSPPFA